MKIVQVHNRYYTGLGGEDTVLDLEHDLLLRNGHSVHQLFVSTAELRERSLWQRVPAGLSTVWSSRGYRLMARTIEEQQPDIIHVHNTFPLLSASICWAAARARVPLVMTLHNYRFACVQGALVRDARTCELCVGRFPWPALRYRCYHGSRALTLASVLHNQVHQRLGTFHRKVSAYIALSHFARGVFLRHGFPAQRLRIKPNFVEEPAAHLGRERRPNQFVFAGLLARSKGIGLLLQAWEKLKLPEAEILVFGQGPLEAPLRERHSGNRSIRFLGWQSRETILGEMARSRLVLIPSRCYEGFPMVLLEALSLGTPVVAPDHGVFPEVLTDGREGFLFRPLDLDSLTDTIRRALASDWNANSTAARALYHQRYTPALNYQQLMEIYWSVLPAHRS